jgi:hypothetical protein
MLLPKEKYQNTHNCPLEGYKEGVIGVYILINNYGREYNKVFPFPY